ncbi:MAG: hypothetical protein WBN66_04340 [Smithella sp.]
MKITREALPKQSLDILKNEASRAQFANSANCFWKHVPIVLIRPMLATK